MRGRATRERLRELTGCNVDPGHVGAKIAWLAAHEPEVHDAAAWFLLPGAWVAWRASGELAVDPSNASSTAPARPAHARVVRRGLRRRSASIRRGSRRCARAHTVLGPILPWLREATGLPATTLVVLGAGDEMAATLGAGVVEPGVVCDVMGTAEPVCAVVSEPAFDPTGLVELHPHADPDTWLLENPGWLSGGAYRWFRDELGGPESARAAESGLDVYELLNELARVRAARRRRRHLGARAGRRDGAGVERPRARRLVRRDRGARPRAPRPRAARGQRAGAARRDRGDRRRRPPAAEIVCVGGGARGPAAAASCARTSPACRSPAPTTSRRPRAARRCSPRPARGCTRRSPTRRGRWPAPRAEPVEPDPELRDVYDGAAPPPPALYDALRPLFAAEWELVA